MENTELRKVYDFDFVLTEQEFRRLVQTCQEHFQKISEPITPHIAISAKLKDGSILKSETVDSALSLENSGSKTIQRLTIRFDDGKKEYKNEAYAPPPDWLIQIEFGISWRPISYNVIGKSRDWVFLTVADIDERIRKTKLPPLSHLVQQFETWASIVVGMVVGFGTWLTVVSTADPASALENAYKNGTVKDAIQAMIIVEKARQSTYQVGPFVLAIGIGITASIILVVIAKLLMWIAPAHNFYWGDYVAFYDRHRNMQFIFWTVIVLGILVSVIAGIIVRYIP